jgi:uncharacterized membrane protein
MNGRRCPFGPGTKRVIYTARGRVRQATKPMHYLPLSLPFFSILVGMIAVLLVLLQLGALRYAYLSIGLSPGGAMLVLFGSLVGSYFNIPLVELPQQHIVAGHVVHYFGMRYVVPVVVDWPGTVIAANVGGAIIPVVVSAYLLVRYRLWSRRPWQSPALPP